MALEALNAVLRRERACRVEFFQRVGGKTVLESRSFEKAHCAAARACGWTVGKRRSHIGTCGSSGNEVANRVIERMTIGAEICVGNICAISECAVKRQVLIAPDSFKKPPKVAAVVFFYGAAIAGKPQTGFCGVALQHLSEEPVVCASFLGDADDRADGKERCRNADAGGYNKRLRELHMFSQS